MLERTVKPRLTRLDDVSLVVAELQKLGISGQQLYHQITEIGPVDLDLLNKVLEEERTVN